MGYASKTKILGIYVGKLLSYDPEEESLRISFMDFRLADTFIWKKTPKEEVVELDQILVGLLPVAYHPTGVIIHGLREVRTKWLEYIKSQLN